MTTLPELILHIGAGKAGSTAIQFALKRNGEVLAGQNAAYLGLMLEQVPGAQSHDWCVDGQPKWYFRQPPRERARVDGEVYAVIRAELDRLAADGVDRAIWSNEAFLPSHERIIRIAQRLERDSVRLRIICYLRRHDTWARSFYVQFGLKGKYYNGPVRTFEEWTAAHPVAFADHVEAWQKAFPGRVELFNVDAVGDAVTHFATITAIEGLPSLRANESPSNALLTAFVVHNNQYKEEVSPDIMATLIAPMKILDPRASRLPALEDLLPTTEDLLRLQVTCREDFDRLNAMLAGQGQPALVFDIPEAQSRSTSQWDMNRMMLQMILSLQRQVGELKSEIAAIRNG